MTIKSTKNIKRWRKKMNKFIDLMNDEMCSAKDYYKMAVKYPEYKEMYKQMANQELEHAMNDHKVAVASMSEEDKASFNDMAKMFHQVYVDKYNDIKEEIGEI